ncbi:MAG: YceD family protein [Xanthomonadales bacterium]|nr:YceD family protein [Xanthomonadales bacterium]
MADGRRSFRGTVPLKWMTRLVGMLAPESDAENGVLVWQDASFTASFAFDRQGLVTIAINVKAELPLVCQRSLEPYPEHVDRHSELVVIEDVAEQEALPEQYEPVLVEERRLALIDLVEEELLLAIPQVPRNPDAGELDLPDDVSLETSDGKEQEQTHRPFAGLSGLIKDSAGD